MNQPLQERGATGNDSALSAEQRRGVDAYWRAANYLSVGQICLLDNPLVGEPLTVDDVERRLLGHWGTAPGFNFIYVHLNRAIRARDLDVLYVTGPGQDRIEAIQREARREGRPAPRGAIAEATRVMGEFLRDVMRRNLDARNFHVFGPDEAASNRLGALFDGTDRTWLAERPPSDDHLGPDQAMIRRVLARKSGGP